MRSIRAKTIILNVFAVVFSIIVTTVISAITIANLGHRSASENISLACETGKNNLNYYFKSVEQSTKIVSYLVSGDLDSMSDEEFNNNLSAHVDRSRFLFEEAAINTNGALTYYYRFDLSVTEATGEKGFWYTNLDGKGFVEHEVTDLSDDKWECIWFYQPKETGKSMWLSPYITDNLDKYVVSYNVPVYRNDIFVGVVGIEIDYLTLGEQINKLKTYYDSGFAYIIRNDDASIIYHPTIDILGMDEKDRPETPKEFYEGFKAGEHHIEYTFQGVKKHSYWLDLGNDMSIVVCVNEAEISKSWQSLVTRIVIVSAGLIALTTIIALIYGYRITKPLKELTLAAEEIDRGNYKVELSYKGNNEIGVLTNTVSKLIKNLDEYITDLNSLAYADALTEVRNKSAFDLYIEEMQKRIDNGEKPEFAIAIFDCDNLKDINDEYGHDKGDVYLRNSCHLMCRVFSKSVFYRIGGDEFAAILQYEDFVNRELLKKHFLEKSAEVCQFAKKPWEQIRVSVGIATYDPDVDKSVEDVMVHADHLMYTNKRERKKHRNK